MMKLQKRYQVFKKGILNYGNETLKVRQNFLWDYMDKTREIQIGKN